VCYNTSDASDRVEGRRERETTCPTPTPVETILSVSMRCRGKAGGLAVSISNWAPFTSQQARPDNIRWS